MSPWTAARQAPLSMGIFQARIPEWFAMPSSRGSSQPRDQTQVSCIAGKFFTDLATCHICCNYFFKWCTYESESRSVMSQLFATPWAIQSMEFSRPEYWSLSLLQGIFLTQGSNPGLPHCRQILYQLSQKGSPQMNIFECNSWPKIRRHSPLLARP